MGFAICVITDCERPVHNLKRGWCRKHYRRWQRHGNPTAGEQIPRQQNTGKICSVATCSEAATKRGFCGLHYRRRRIHGDPLILLKPYRVAGPCSVEECIGEYYARGYCYRHYQRWRRTGHTESQSGQKRVRLPCAVPGCTKPRAARGLCSRHYARWRVANTSRRCNVAGCDRNAETRGLCEAHYATFRRHGETAVIRPDPPMVRSRSGQHRPSLRRLVPGLWERDGGICGICRQPLAGADECHVDHIVPVARGGGHDAANLQLAHPLCNRRKWAHLPGAERLPLLTGR